MKNKGRSWKERICALAMAAALVMSGVTSAFPASVVKAEGGNSASEQQAVKQKMEEPEESGAEMYSDGDPVEIIFDVNVDDPTITVKENDSEGEPIQVEKNDMGEYKYTFTEGKSYTYTVSKQGYEDVVKSDFEPTANAADPISVTMTPSPIELNLQSSIELNVGKTADLKVTNKIDDAAYTAEEDKNYIDVAEQPDGSWKITALPLTGSQNDEETAEITVKNDKNSLEAKVTVTVKKISLNNHLSISVEPDGTTDDTANINEVTITLNGLPDDAAGTIQFKVNNEDAGNVTDVTQTKSVVYQAKNGEVFEGKLNIEAVYSGDDKYSSVTVNKETSPYLKEIPLEIAGESNKTLTYGDTGWKQPIPFPLKASTVAGRTVTYSILTDVVSPADVEVVSVDPTTGAITPQNAGTATVRATAAASGNLKESSVDYTVTVNQKAVTVEEINWTEASKVYDGDKNIELQGSLKGNTDEKITIAREFVEIESADVAEDLDVTIADESYDLVNKAGVSNYVLKINKEDENYNKNKVSDKVEITLRPLYVEAENHELSYGQNLKDAIQAAEGVIVLIKDGTGERTGANGANTGLVPGQTIDSAKINLPNAILNSDNYAEPDKLYVGTFANIIVPNITDDNKCSGNYMFVFDDRNGKKGTLTVTAQELSIDEILSNIDVDDSNSSNIFKEKEGEKLSKIWMRIGAKDDENNAIPNSSLKLQVKDQTYYNKVYVCFGKDYIIDATDTGISDETWIANPGVEIYLQREVAGIPSGDTKTLPKECAGLFQLDTQAPTAEIKSFTSTIASQLTETLTFGVFKNKAYDAEIAIKDTDGKGNAGSGFDSMNQQYYVWKLGNEKVDEQLGTTAVVEKIRNITAATTPEDGWKKFDQQGSNGNYKIHIGEAQNEEELQNNYLIFIKTVDHVGNCSVYVSNGLVIDMKGPEITCTFEEKNKTYQGVSGIGYQGDAKYKLTIQDPEDFFSGISKVEVTATDAGETLESETLEGEKEVIKVIEEGRVYENSYTFEPGLKEEGYSYEELGESITINGVVKFDNVKSNNVLLTIKAYDRAGNETQTMTQNLILDKTIPKMAVEFDKNEPKNGIYYQDSRTMTITYTERNFGFGTTDDKNIENVSKEYVWFDLKMEGDSAYKQYSLKELDDLKGIEVDSKIEDSQASVNDENQYTEGRTNKVVIHFTGQNTYEIAAHCKDKTANESKGETYKFAVDTEAPVIKDVTYEYFDTTTDQWEAYDPEKAKSADVQVSMTVKDHYFELDNDEKAFVDGQIQFRIQTDKTAEGDKTAYQTKYSDLVNTKANWKSLGDDEWKVTLTFENDANYNWSLNYTDLSGKSAASGEHRFTLDKTAPTGSIQIRESIWNQLFEVVTFGYFSNTTEEVILKNADHTSGVASMQYYKYIPDAESRDQFAGLTYKQLEKITEWEDGIIDGETRITLDTEEQAVVYTKIVDRAGNVTYINSQEGVIVDKTSPSEPQITIMTPEPAQGIFNQNVEFTMNITDPESGGTYAGLREVYYEVRNNGTVTQAGDYNAELTDKKARRHSMTKTETVDAQLNNSNNVTIWVKAVDYAGNTAEATKDIKIDITDPEVRIEFDLNDPLNGKYYHATRTATIYVTERNFNEEAVNLSITNTDGTMPAVSGWTISDQAGISDEAVNSCTVAFAADGDYTMDMSFTDMAGNGSNQVTIPEFTIDKTIPTIQVDFDNHNVQNGKYYDAPRTATITVNEHNFNGSEVQTAIQAALQAQGISAPGVNGWSTNGDTHSATVSFSTDGDYSFTVNYTDLAGNAAEVFNVDEFTIDQTKPEIEIFDIADKSANNGTVAPGVRYSDVNYNEAGVNITITGPKHKTMSLDGTRTSIPNGESIKMADFAHDPSVDDVYTLSAEITDMAGNSEEKQVVFSVNRFGSNYIFGEKTAKFLDKYYSNEEQELIITEINVDTLEHHGISYGRDGELTTLEKGSDYTVKESGNEASWKSYQYTIKADNFAEEGLYNVTIDSRDRAKNEVNNKVKDANIEFVIDKTAPTVVITGVEDQEQYRANDRDIAVAVSDNIAIDGMDLYIDDDENPVESYDAEKIMKQKGEIPYTLESSNDWQKIKAVAVDAAGNRTETSEYRVLITSNILVQFYRNTPLVIGASVSVLAVIAVVLFLVSKKKKKAEEAE